MEKNFNAKEVEKKWSEYWLENKTFKSSIDESRPSYTVLIPPPNVTGVLHFGHVLNNSLQDFFIRKARKQGFNACWVPGIDHAAIATEAKVVGYLREKGIKKSDLSREEFLDYCWEWKEKYGGIILDQLKTIGAGCDWDRVTFTLDDHYYKAVVRVFVDLYKKGYIYKGKRIINWDCEAQTALSNEEVIYNEAGEKAQLFYLKYKYVQGDGYLTVATTRPETIFADMAVAVNPDDERYKCLIGQEVLIPLINKPIKIIADSYVDKEFGTGCLKVTPAHDINDYEIGMRHGLEIVDILNDDGTLNELCQYPEFIGKDRFKVRREIKTKLEEIDCLEKVEDIVNKVGRSERTNSVVEPKLSLQWYVDMKNLSKKAYEVVMSDEVEFFPKYHKNTFNHWMTNIRDWCISRQLWWGHRIPAWYDEDGNFYVGETAEEAYEQYESYLKANNRPSCGGIEGGHLRQDEDVLDTWASSWLWPLEVFNGFEHYNRETGKIDVSKSKDLDYYLPTQIIVTGPDIMFLWITRMIIANYEYTDRKPFEKVFFTGIVRDKLGRKLSKQLGNSPDLYELIDKYGMDGIRYGMMSISPAGNDILFDEKSLEIGRNFTNKIWNAFRLIKSWEIVEGKNTENEAVFVWFEALLQKNVNSFLDNIDNLRISEALKDLYSFVWDDLCSWYLEMIKPEFQKPIDSYTYEKTMQFFETVLSLLNPIMPFITEEMWCIIRERSSGELCSEHQLPIKGVFNQEVITNQNLFIELVVKVRELRSNLKLKNREEINLSIDKELLSKIEVLVPKIKKMTWVNEINTDLDSSSSTSSVVAGKKIIVHSEKKLDSAEVKTKLEDEINYTRGFIKSIEAKLSNEKFVTNAPEKVLDMERKKLSDGCEKLKQLEQNLSQLSGN
jgi:valyl-tRNA synthetase